MSLQVNFFPEDNYPSPDARTLLELFYFRRLFDQTTLSLCVQHFQPLASIFEVPSDTLKDFFLEYRQVRAYLGMSSLFSPELREKAERYAEQQLRILSTKQSLGALLMRTDARFPEWLLRSKFPIKWLFCHPQPFFEVRKPVVAVVGSRKSNASQLEVARNISRQ